MQQSNKILRKTGSLVTAGALLTSSVLPAIAPPEAEAAKTKGKKPNILLIMSDDVGISNLSCYAHGLVGYQTPNIDRIAKDGVMFTDYYAEQSSTAGRSAFITGQLPIRTGLTKVGLPGAEVGLQKQDPTLAELLKPHGYVSGQFGKNHLGDRNEFLPTVHGFSEFYGNLYHLNAEEEPEHPNYPKDPAFHKKFGPRGVLDCVATRKNDSTKDPRFGVVGKQKIVDTGPLTRKRMETADEEFLDRTEKFIKKHTKAEKPWMAWINTSRMHFWTHIKKENQGKSGVGVYGDGMLEHDGHVGQLLDLLDELKIADNTIVIYTCDNGPHYNAWPDGGISPFRAEKNTNWEGGFRVPAMVRWPGKIQKGVISNEIMSHLDWVPTLMAAVGDAKIKRKLLNGHNAAGKSFKVHLDGYNFLPYLLGKTSQGPRKEIFYFGDTGEMLNLRYQDWKIVFAEQRAKTFRVWSEPFVTLRIPKIFNLRMDPFERADTDANAYDNWWINHAFILVPAQAFVGKLIATFKKYPPRQSPSKFNVEDVLKRMEKTKQD